MADENGGIIENLAERIEQRLTEQPFQRDEAFLERMLGLMEIFNRYFDAEVSQLDRLPEEGPMLLVGNHSGGTLVPDTTAVLSAWYRERGIEDPLFGLAFDGMFGIPWVEDLMRKIGEIPANHENAAKAFASGASLLVYPGGAHEAFRPWYDRNKIDFNNHYGFIKLALRQGVPVVPVVAHGGHHSTIVLSRGEELAQQLGFDKLRMGVAPVLFQFPWGISTPMLPGIPLPAKISVEVCEALDWRHLGPEAADDPEIVEQCYVEITSRMQQTLDRLARKHPHPVLDRMLSLIPGMSWARRPTDDSVDESSSEVAEDAAEDVRSEAC